MFKTFPVVGEKSTSETRNSTMVCGVAIRTVTSVDLHMYNTNRRIYKYTYLITINIEKYPSFCYNINKSKLLRFIQSGPEYHVCDLIFVSILMSMRFVVSDISVGQLMKACKK